MLNFQFKTAYFVLLTFYFFLASCSVQKQIAKSAKDVVLNAKALKTAHIGISIFDPAASKYLYNYQGDKYFVPASNTKLPTCYAAMKYLGDSLVAGRIIEYRNDLIVYPSGDPTFLNEEFSYQPLLSKLKQKGKSIIVRFGTWQEEKWGSGWSWNDYKETYMAERSAMPMYGNIVKLLNIDDSAMSVFGTTDTAKYTTYPKLFSNRNYWDYSYHMNEITKKYTSAELLEKSKNKAFGFKTERNIESNKFFINLAFEPQKIQKLTFSTSSEITNRLLEDTIYKRAINENIYFGGHEVLNKKDLTVIHSQPTDSLLKPMMHRSDNFFAEQALLMVSNERLGFMNDEKIIDTLLKTDFSDLPQKPRWADGSGLSRYNLFTPQDFVAILNKMKNEFGMERIKVILPTGGEGTISNYYKADSGYIYGKTGTLAGVVAFSGFLYTKSGRLLIFSTLINNHQTSSTEVRRAIEKFLQEVRSIF